MKLTVTAALGPLWKSGHLWPRRARACHPEQSEGPMHRSCTIHSCPTSPAIARRLLFREFLGTMLAPL